VNPELSHAAREISEAFSIGARQAKHASRTCTLPAVAVPRSHALRIELNFVALVPVQVRTDTQTYRESYRERKFSNSMTTGGMCTAGSLSTMSSRAWETSRLPTDPSTSASLLVGNPFSSLSSHAIQCRIFRFQSVDGIGPSRVFTALLRIQNCCLKSATQLCEDGSQFGIAH
jgi:hypothetical protein